jgi:DNA-binding transcriptional regulator LsrR (DeoR family)
MPRLNIYLPDDVYDLANRWRDSRNLSEICARAIRDELGAAEDGRSFSRVLEKVRPPADVELALKDAFGLRDVRVVETPTDTNVLRDSIGRAAADYLDASVCDGTLLGVAGGRQTWAVVQHLSPRQIRSTICAFGIHRADPQLLHVHPNTLATLLWLLYSPRSEAHVVGARPSPNLWTDLPAPQPVARYFVLSSCSPFNPNSPFGRLVGAEMSSALIEHKVIGDYAYVFFTENEEEFELAPAADEFRLSANLLKTLSKREDARTMLIAGGADKLKVMRAALTKKLCNTLITDRSTAQQLLQ